MVAIMIVVMILRMSPVQIAFLLVMVQSAIVAIFPVVIILSIPATVITVFIWPSVIVAIVRIVGPVVVVICASGGNNWN
jgi:hypothetical protein